MHLVVACFLGTLAVAYFIVQFTVGGHIKIFMDYALFAYFLLTILFPVVCVIPFINRHEHHKLWSFFLSKGISRSTLIVQLWSAFVLIITILEFIFYCAAVITLKLLTNTWILFLWPAFITLSLQGIFFVSCALFFALITQPLIAQLATICVYCVCYTNHEWIAILQQNGSPELGRIATVLYYFLPDLSLLDIKSEVIYQLPFNYSALLLSFLYITLFSIIFLVVSSKVFNKKVL